MVLQWLLVLCLTGQYLYMESSAPRRQGHKARLVSPEVNVRRACLRFYYHMKGREIGSLAVKLLTKAGYMNDLNWEKKGQQGDRWIEAKVDITMGLSYKVIHWTPLLMRTMRSVLFLVSIRWFFLPCSFNIFVFFSSVHPAHLLRFLLFNVACLKVSDYNGPVTTAQLVKGRIQNAVLKFRLKLETTRFSELWEKVRPPDLVAEVIQRKQIKFVKSQIVRRVQM